MLWPTPDLDQDSQPFWTGGHSGQLLITTCRTCGFRTHPPTPRCPSCFGEDVACEPVSGRGRIYTFTINRQAWTADLEVPYVIAIVELEEQAGLRLLTNIVDCDVEVVRIDMPVEVRFVERGAASIPVFAPVSQ